MDNDSKLITEAYANVKEEVKDWKDPHNQLYQAVVDCYYEVDKIGRHAYQLEDAKNAELIQNGLRNILKQLRGESKGR